MPDRKSPSQAASRLRDLFTPKNMLFAVTVIALLAVAMAVLSMTRATAADARSMVLQHKLGDANSLVRQYAARNDSLRTDSDITTAKDDVIRARLRAAESSVPLATTVTAGVHLVGVDVAPGAYVIDAPTSRCVYGWFVDSRYDDTRYDGTGIDLAINLNEGDLFRSTGCGTWRTISE